MTLEKLGGESRTNSRLRYHVNVQLKAFKDASKKLALAKHWSKISLDEIYSKNNLSIKAWFFSVYFILNLIPQASNEQIIPSIVAMANCKRKGKTHITRSYLPFQSNCSECQSVSSERFSLQKIIRWQHDFSSKRTVSAIYCFRSKLSKSKCVSSGSQALNIFSNIWSLKAFVWSTLSNSTINQ